MFNKKVDNAVFEVMMILDNKIKSHLPSLRAPSDTLLLSFTLPTWLFLSVCSPESLELDAAGEAGSPRSCSLSLGVLALSVLASLTDASGEVWISVKVSCPK
jgi:hypothetical protein